MNKFHITLKMSLTCLILIASFGMNTDETYAFSDQVIQQGAVGDDVIELQARLQHIGFYNGTIDGVFGWQTYWAARNFQYEFGIKVDGLVGQKMKNKLVETTEYDEGYVKGHLEKGNKPQHYGGTSKNETQVKKGTDEQQAEKETDKQQAEKDTDKQEEKTNVQQSVSTPKGFSNNDIKLMSNAVHGEARGEPYIGQVAVAAVILNRMNSASFPNDISGVIFEPRAFTAVADGQIWLEPNETARKAVIDAINGWDPTGSALYYFNPDTATSGWIWTRPQIKTIGKHIFAK